ncbi:MAG TPA: hypothetical protein VMH50_17800, partial [Thermoleophilia bacterium]|nr:hypothetical protein [Thermoleophilia bacterium]
MSGDGSYQGEYPGQMGMPFGDEPRDEAPGRAGGVPERDAGRQARGAMKRDAGRSADDDDELFVWNDLRPSRRERAARASGDWRAPEEPTGPGRRYEPADGYETSEEWEEWLEPEAPHGAEAVGPLPERHAGPRRRRLSAGAVLLAMLLGFFFGGLLDVGN